MQRSHLGSQHKLDWSEILPTKNTVENSDMQMCNKT